MHDNFKKILYLAGNFGVIIREHVEKLIYTGNYGYISANTTFAKLEREHGLLKRIDRGKRKTDGYKLTTEGAKEFKSLFGYEPKIYSSGDKLSHSVEILNFYSEIYNDAKRRGLIYEYHYNEEKKFIRFHVQQEIKFHHKSKDRMIIPDGFGLYRYSKEKGVVFYLEIENSDRRSALVANKTIDNYESYYVSGKWRLEKWQPQNFKVFPIVLIVTFSDWKLTELVRIFREKKAVDIKYYFTTYSLLKENGLSGNIWTDINNDTRRIINVQESIKEVN